jgi:hypothetical protein
MDFYPFFYRFFGRYDLNRRNYTSKLNLFLEFPFPLDWHQSFLQSCFQSTKRLRNDKNWNLTILCMSCNTAKADFRSNFPCFSKKMCEVFFLFQNMRSSWKKKERNRSHISVIWEYREILIFFFSGWGLLYPLKKPLFFHCLNFKLVSLIAGASRDIVLSLPAQSFAR